MTKKNNTTGIYSQDESQKTTVYNSNDNITTSYTNSVSSSDSFKSHGLSVGSIITLKGFDYTVIDIISSNTLEAIIYKIQNSESKLLALKLYFDVEDSHKGPNHEALDRIKSITDDDILKLYDYAVLPEEKYLNRFCYEISDYARGGDINNFLKSGQRFSYDFIQNSLIPQIVKGIRRLHENKIYHCDLKPSNIFFIDEDKKDIVIGDYGSSKAYDIEISKDVNKSSTVVGTNYYMAPEQPRGFISEKLDYYSLGIIALQLLYPEELTKNEDLTTIDKKKFEQISERQYNQMPVLLNFKDDFSRVNRLIEGLTLFNPQSRWGKHEIDKWMNGNDVDVKYKSADYGAVYAVKLGYATIKNDVDFINVLNTKETWWEDLFEDPDTYASIKTWIGSYQDRPSRIIFDAMISYYMPFGKKYVKEAAIRYFKPKTSVHLFNSNFDFYCSDDIVKDVNEYINIVDINWKKESVEELRFAIFKLEFALKQLKLLVPAENITIVEALIDTLLAACGLTNQSFENYKTQTQTIIDERDQDSSHSLLLDIFYAFNPDRKFTDSNNNQINTLEDVGYYYVKNNKLFSDYFLNIEKNKFFISINRHDIVSLNYNDLIFEIFKNYTESKVDLMELTFDKHQNFYVFYKYYKSLNTHFKKQNIETDFTTKSDDLLLYVHKKKIFKSFESEYDNFISEIKNKHNIATLTYDNLYRIKRKFIKDSRIRLLYVHSGQILALIIAIPLIFLIYAIASDKLIIDRNLNFSWRSENIVNNTQPTTTIVKYLYVVKTNANVRSQPSTKSSISTVATKGEIVEVIQKYNEHWFKVKTKYGAVGYIYSNLLIEYSN